METRGLGLLGGIGLGAGLMYFLDPQLGTRRRALARDQFTSLLGQADDAARCVARDVGNRAQGLAAEARSLLAGGQPDDRQLAGRIRSELGRVVSHPGSLEVSVQGGRVTLRGPILEHEVDDVLCCVSSVRGVSNLDNQLEVHREPGNVPGLQGGSARPGPAPDILQENWSPATRTLVGAAGVGLLGYSLTQRFPVACVLGTLGLAMAARSFSNRTLRRMLGVTGDRRVMEVHKTITVGGPPERVFPFFADYANFPRFMRRLREVRDLGGGRSHWVASGPAGVPVSWDAVITRFIPNQVIGWKSEPGSVVANAGVIRFEPVAGGNTRVDIRLAYNPPGGALGHLAALLFGADPRSALDEDLVRLKGLIEQGSTRAPGKGEVARQDLPAGHAAAHPAGAGTP